MCSATSGPQGADGVSDELVDGLVQLNRRLAQSQCFCYFAWPVAGTVAPCAVALGVSAQLVEVFGRLRRLRIVARKHLTLHRRHHAPAGQLLAQVDALGVVLDDYSDAGHTPTAFSGIGSPAWMRW